MEQVISRPERVVYLFGAGATQAELDFQSITKRVLMATGTGLDGTTLEGISEQIISTVRESDLQWLNDISRASNMDIEKLISLYEDINQGKAELLRSKYRECILECLKELKEPKLAIALFDMHNEYTEEELIGIISLNHDYLLDEASEKIFGGVNLGFHFTSSAFNKITKSPLIIKLHGSFNWESGIPICLLAKDKIKDCSKPLWIPPSVLKEPRSYPFNKLVALAHELLLECDVLRVVGCSLQQNDWTLLTLLFNVQNMRGHNCFRIEIIDSEDSGKDIIRRCAYLRKTKTLSKLGAPFNDFEQDPQNYKKPENPFSYFLRVKADDAVKGSKIDHGKIHNELKEVIDKG